MFNAARTSPTSSVARNIRPASQLLDDRHYCWGVLAVASLLDGRLAFRLEHLGTAELATFVTRPGARVTRAFNPDVRFRA